MFDSPRPFYHAPAPADAEKTTPAQPEPEAARPPLPEAAAVGFRPPLIPASFFGIVLGLAGLGNGWRAAHLVWSLPAWIGEALFAVAGLVWGALLILYGLKWVFARDEALSEARHPVQCCFIGLVGVSTLLIAIGALPHARPVATVLFVLGALFTLGFALWQTGSLWQGGRDPETITPALYLPTGAGGFVLAAAAAALGATELGQLAFGLGLLSWLAIESVLLNRLSTRPAMPPALRPTLGIQMAPPAVGAVAYLAVSGGKPDLIAHALIGYGIVQALLLLRLLPWIRQQPFTPAYWSFTFGAAALATAPLRLMAQGDHGIIADLAPTLFMGANLVTLLVAIGTMRLLLLGRNWRKAD